MTRDEILAMNPGPELDALVAERVMGWKRTNRRPCYPEAWANYPQEWFLTPDGSVENVTNLPRYSADITVAWEVMEKLRGLFDEDYFWHIATLRHGRVSAYFAEEYPPATGKRIVGRSEADTAPEAICKAALLSVVE
jgi:hypothetical protein